MKAKSSKKTGKATRRPTKASSTKSKATKMAKHTTRVKSTSKSLASKSGTQKSKGQKSKVQKSKVQKSKGQKSKGQKPKVQKSKGQKSKVQKSKGQKSKVQKSKGQKSKVQKSKGQKSKGQKPKVQKSKGQKSKGQKPKGQKPKAVPLVRSRSKSLRNILLAKREAIMTQMREQLGQSLTDDQQRRLESAMDSGDQALFDLEREMGISLQEMRNRERQMIEEALSSLEEGTYGQCAECDADISEKRLQALPFARYCIECQARLELLEKIEKGEQRT